MKLTRDVRIEFEGGEKPKSVINGQEATFEEGIEAMKGLDKITHLTTSIDHTNDPPRIKDENEPYEPTDFEKSLTPEERKAPSYLDWSDERLGQAVRALASILQDNKGTRALSLEASTFNFAKEMHDINASTSICEVHGVTYQGEPIGDYTVFAVRTDQLSKNEQMRLRIAKWLMDWNKH